MITCLNDILYSEEPAGLIEPIELTQEDVQGIEIVPLCLLGLFNPMGPTLIALNLIIKDDAPSGAILYTSLNPFSQTRLLTARAPSDPIELFELFKNLYRLGDGCILGAPPNLVLPGMQQEAFDQAVREMLFGLIASVPSEEPLSKTVEDYQAHWRDPWNRIPKAEDMMGMIREAIGGEATEPECVEPNPEDFEAWFSIVTDMKHISGELGAIIQAWGGSVNMAGGMMPHMEIGDVAAEMGALGFPYLEGVLEAG